MDIKSKLIEVLGKNIQEEKLMADIGAYILKCITSGEKLDLKAMLKMIDDAVDQQKLLKDAVSEVVLPSLDEVVAKSETKIDDVVLDLAKKLLAGVV